MGTSDKSKLIVLVDDDETNNFICKKMLKIFDPSIQTKEFMDPTEALRYLKNNSNDEVSLLLLDLNMPKINGWQFLDSLNGEDLRSNVVILTSSIDPNDVQRARDKDKVKDFWTKPLTLDMLGKYFAE